MEYDYVRFEQLIQNLLEDMYYDPDDLTIGEDISHIPEVKIIFDGYGDWKMRMKMVNIVTPKVVTPIWNRMQSFYTKTL